MRVHTTRDTTSLAERALGAGSANDDFGVDAFDGEDNDVFFTAGGAGGVAILASYTLMTREQCARQTARTRRIAHHTAVARAAARTVYLRRNTRRINASFAIAYSPSAFASISRFSSARRWR